MKFLNIPFLILHFSCYTLMTFLMIHIAIYADDTTLYSKQEQASDLWQQLKLASDLQDTRAGSGFLISMLENSTCFVWPV